VAGAGAVGRPRGGAGGGGAASGAPPFGRRRLGRRRRGASRQRPPYGLECEPQKTRGYIGRRGRIATQEVRLRHGVTLWGWSDGRNEAAAPACLRAARGRLNLFSLKMLPWNRKKSILNPELVEVRRNELSTSNPYRLYPELCNPGLNRTLDLFGGSLG
jgi:hypothetical protein